MKTTFVAIMAGGIGSRFWPYSREEKPKQFLDILGVGKSLLRLTFERYKKIVPTSNILILTNSKYQKLVLDELPEIDPGNILSEPVRKNTAPCVAYAAFKVYEKDPNAKLIVSPADHFIANQEAFSESIEKAIENVESTNGLLTLGIMPSRPDTGYGYIQFNSGKEKSTINEVYPVKTFTEKPDQKLAKQFIDSGDFLWNSGMFIWKAKTIVKAFRDHLQEVYDAFARDTDKYNSDGEIEYVKEAFEMCPNISIDYGILEKASNVYVQPVDFDWTDLGTWNSLYHNIESDYYKNVHIRSKNAIMHDSSGNLISIPDKKLLLARGLKDYIIVDTEDALLICPISEEQSVKKMVSEAKRQDFDKYF